MIIRRVNQSDQGLGEMIRVNYTFGDSYPTGGEPITARDFKFRIGNRINRIQFDVNAQFAIEYLPTDERTGFVKAYQNIAGVTDEVTNGTDLSGFTIGATVEGR